MMAFIVAKMNKAFVTLLVLCSALLEARSIGNQIFVLNDDGYYFRFITDDQQSREETGKIVNKGKEDEYMSVSGSYSYVDPSNQKHTVYYMADDKGYRESPLSATATAPFMPQAPTTSGVSTCLLNSLCGQGI